MIDVVGPELIIPADARGVAVVCRGQQHVLPLPSCFRSVLWRVELGQVENGAPASIRVTAQADEMQLSMTVYLKTAMVRFDARRTGRLRYKP